MSNNPILEAALDYVAQGFRVFPVGLDKKPLTRHGLKDAKQTQLGVREYWGKYPNAGIGLVTNGLIVLDFDAKDGGLESKASIEAQYGTLPRTRTHRTGGGGLHYLYRNLNGRDIRNTVGLGGYQGVDLRANGGYVLVPPSPHESGNHYKVLDDCEISPAPDWLLELVSKKTPAQAEAISEGQPIPEGQRNATLTSFAGTMRWRGLSQSAIEAALQEVNRRQCQPPLPDTEVRQIAKSIARYPSAEAASRAANTKQADVRLTDTGNAELLTGLFDNQIRFDHLTDMGNAERLVRYYGDKLRYCYERKRWLVWADKVWEWDAGSKITALAKLTVRNIYYEAGDEPDEKKRKELVDHAKRSESDHKINAMINLAQSEVGIPVKITNLDTNPWLFNCLNGTLDLKTGKLSPHRKEDMLTILVPVEYHPDAQCPRWLSFLDRVAGDNTELVGYLQRAVGYSLTGDTKSQVLFFLYGLGSNGKSTFVTTIRKLTGEYGGRVNTDLFMVKDRNAGGPKEALANLKGKRYVVASELEDGRRLAVSLIKDMTGGETITADRKYEHEVEYHPTFKLWLVGNHKPVIADTTLSIWRRMKLVPFIVTIPDKEIDMDLPAKLEEELQGILSWAVKGCLDWQQSGLSEPGAVRDATTSYRHEQDILGDFIEDCCQINPLLSIPKSELKEEYQRWCEENSVESVKQKTFRNRLIERGIIEGKSGGVRYWKGLTLQTLVPNGTRDVPNSDTNGTRGAGNTGTLLRKGIQERFMEKDALNVPSVPITPKTDDHSVPSVSNDFDNGTSFDYPSHPCLCGCKEPYYLSSDNQWFCPRCHPAPPALGRTKKKGKKSDK